LANSLINFLPQRKGVLNGLAALLLTACINTPLPDYYVITPERVGSDSGVNAAVNPELALGIGPVTIPETVNRPNIVTPLDSNQVEVAEYHRWSEPLIENISRVVVTNIADRLSLSKLYAYPWLGNPVDYQVRIDVLQMTGTPAESVSMQVRWQVLTGEKPRQLLLTRITEYDESISTEGYSAMVSAYSRLVAALSDDISKAVAAIDYQVSHIPDANTAALKSG
jgi:uncharacterized lipoprotein YmbA